ncbi:hypothetical protein [Pantoea sp. BAV 3049]|uniref:hypothetical protein n=1 Tax=Pantoea sp. BAV 3049 TaxID=2654188 RepID=UPI00131E01F9|nr:hypothetical protein [Pantoea sp. BAV 3049]
MDTIAGKKEAIKMAAALHRCPVAEISLTNPAMLALAQDEARNGNFIEGNKLLKQAYQI